MGTGRECAARRRRILQIYGFPDAERHQIEIIVRLAEAARRQGKYNEAIQHQFKALESKNVDPLKKIEILGELGVNYNGLGDLKTATKYFQEQYECSEMLTLEAEAQKCRAAGNLGMVKLRAYNESPKKSDQTLLLASIQHLEERVKSAPVLARRACELDRDGSRSRLRKKIELWEAIGHSRLSVAFLAKGETKRAIAHGRIAVEITKESQDPTVLAISRFFYGNALLQDGQRAAARQEFTEGRCTPAIAFSKEPSPVHRRYLQTVVDEGVDLLAYDEQGYSALDYAEYNGDNAAAKIVLSGLLRQIGVEHTERERDLARLRKHFRQIFHANFRPILNEGRVDCTQTLRMRYQGLLAREDAKRQRFDVLRLVSYQDFIGHGRLPRFEPDSTLTRTFTEIQSTSPRTPFIVFLSYRWTGPRSNRQASTPDDAQHTQYRRMVHALRELLALHPYPDDTYIWLDSACINQEDFEPGRRERGINALPIFIAQCDVMISLVDAQYFTRTWCAAEVLIMQALRQSSSKHLWYVHNLHSAERDRIRGSLDRGVDREELKPSGLKVSNESDRRYIQFLERQSLLLGKTRGL